MNITRRNVLGSLALSAVPATAFAEGIVVMTTPSPEDPLVTAINDYHEACKRFNALPYRDTIDEEDADIEATVGPMERQLIGWDQPAKSLTGVHEALKLMKKQGMVLDNMGTALLDAALGFLETA